MPVRPPATADRSARRLPAQGPLQTRVGQALQLGDSIGAFDIVHAPDFAGFLVGVVLAPVRFDLRFLGLPGRGELLLRLFVTDAEQVEDLFLHRLLVDTDRPATDLGTIDHHVVGARQGLAVQRQALGGGEGVQLAQIFARLAQRAVDRRRRRLRYLRCFPLPPARRMTRSSR